MTNLHATCTSLLRRYVLVHEALHRNERIRRAHPHLLANDVLRRDGGKSVRSHSSGSSTPPRPARSVAAPPSAAAPGPLYAPLSSLQRLRVTIAVRLAATARKRVQREHRQRQRLSRTVQNVTRKRRKVTVQ